MLIVNVGPLQLPSRKGSGQIFPATLECQSDSEAGRTAISEVTSKTKKAAKPKTSKFSISTKSTAGVSNSEHEEVLEVDPNNGRKKRRKTDPPATKDADDNAQASSAGPNSVPPSHESQQKIPRDNKSSSSIAGVRDSKLMAESTSLKQSIIEGGGSDHTLHTPDKKQFPIPTIRNAEVSAGSVIEASGNTPNSSAASESKIKATSTGGKTTERKPSKVLRLNLKTGTIGSPPAKKSKPLGDKPEKGTLKGNRQGLNSRIVTIRYGLSSIGLKVDQILNNKKLPPPVADKVECPEITSTDPSKPLKSIHPLFLGKVAAKLSSPKKLPKQDAPDVDAQRQIGSIILGRTRPGSLDNSALPSKVKVSAFSEFGSAGKVLKFPGAVEPAWPARGMVHVRGHAQGMNEVQQQGQYAMQIRSNIKKSKYQAIEVLAKEDVVGALATDLCIGDVAKGIQEINLDQFPALPSCLRLPVKHFETGADLQRRVRREICTSLPSPNTVDTSSSEDEVRGSSSTRGRIHPALEKTYNSIATSLSAFDQGQCETQPWTHKYSPRSAAEVLQTGKAAFILKEWLQTLTVTSVETGTRNRSGSRASSVSRHSATSKPGYPGKRKRKSKKLEGFVVSSEEEDNDMDEISEPEDDPSPRGSQGLLKKTVVRAGDMGARGFKDSVRLTNAVVVSGPHGCGKTAATYAVAKELGFEVFEINSSSRRSGKDILEKVGDMTRNHLVQRSQIQSQVDPIDEDAQRISDALADDLKSGRQGTMNSFFKPKPSKIAKPKSKKPISVKEQSEATKNNFAPKVPAKHQKQSLILLEEVDILYEEDKQFWATVLNLIAQSKRPIIMTCNDESALPLQSLSLHAIIRFMPPPIDLAVDYMLLVAACEGHALRRDAVSALYESRYLDLRASLMELDFWCQFAVGDLKCGLDWYYPRWPRGSDIDTEGNVIRVVSEGSLGTGMGWLSQDFLYSHLHHLDIEEEILHEAWDGWNLDIGDWQQNLDLTAWADKTTALSTSTTDYRSSLNMYVNFSEAMSVADLCSGSAFAPSDRVCVHSRLQSLRPNFLHRFCLISLFQNCLARPEMTTSLLMSFLKPLH